MERSGSALSRSALEPGGERPARESRYRLAFLDWLGCATAGASERAALSARAAGNGLPERVLAAGVAGHVLDFDDTYSPGLAHLSAPTAPVALVLGAELGLSVDEALEAYAEGFEAMGALARSSHPALYDRGWHPTAVCGAVGAAVTASWLLGHRRDEVAATASRLALAQAGGLRRSFGSDAKALQVGAAAATGVVSARLADAGASATADLATGPGGFQQAFGGSWADPDGPAAVQQNWIKAYPCCLQTHSSIEAAAGVRQRAEARSILVSVHPRARQAAPYDDVGDGLAAKFSIPYTVAYTLLHGPPLEPSCFRDLDAEARRLAAERVRVELDASLPENGAVVKVDGAEPVTVQWAIGSPARPMTDDQLAAKLARLAGSRLDGLLDDPRVDARGALSAAGLN